METLCKRLLFFENSVNKIKFKIEIADSFNVFIGVIVACNYSFYQDFGTIDISTAVSVHCGTILAYSNNFKFHSHKKGNSFKIIGQDETTCSSITFSHL